MVLACPRCRALNLDVARFCARCGLSLRVGSAGVLGAGHTQHPRPATVPPDFAPVLEATDLYFGWTASGGGVPLVGTEPLTVTVFNAGYALSDVALDVHARDAAGQTLCTLRRELTELPAGEAVRIEIASYELPAPVRDLQIELVSAAFAPVTD